MSKFMKSIALIACVMITGGSVIGCNADDFEYTGYEMEGSDCESRMEIPGEGKDEATETFSTESDRTTAEDIERLKEDYEFPEIGRVISVSIDEIRKAVVNEQGDLYVWGSNDNGFLGIGKTEDEVNRADEPIKIMENVKYVTLDCYTGAAITNDGELYTWGNNMYGQLGTCDNKNRLSPVHVLDDIVKVDIGSSCMAAISDDGSLYTWGSNESGVLGCGQDSFDLLFCTEPCAIMQNVIEVDMGDGHGAAITADNRLFVWGSNRAGNFGNGTQLICDRASHEFPSPLLVLDDVVDVSCRYGVTAAVTADGSLYTCGSNTNGELGIGQKDKDAHYEFIKIMDNVESVRLGKISSQSDSCFAITKAGELYTWGDNYGGKLGDGTEDSCFTPTKIMDGIIYAESGNHIASAIGSDGSLYMWGKLNDDEPPFEPVKLW